MTETPLSRRELLGGAVVGLGAVTIPGGSLAASQRPTRYNVGIESPAAERAAKNAANAVSDVVVWEDGLKTVTGRFPDRAVARLQRRPDVRYIERDGALRAIGGSGGQPDQTLPWGVDRVDGEVGHRHGETGANTDIAIIDTGIDSNHPDLEPNLGTGHAIVSAGSKYAESWDDDNGHGTHVAGIAGAADTDAGVVGVATEATLHAVKVLNSGGAGTFSDVARGIRIVADRGYDVANMSLGGPKSYMVEDAVEYAYTNGVFVVAAAGNLGPCEGCVHYPAAEPEVVAVSATAEDDSLAVFSSTGPEVDIAAPGVGILSTVPGGDYGRLSGTSMAAPHVAGAGAHLRGTGLTNAEARDRLEATAENIGLGGAEQGYGFLDVAASLGLDSSDDEANLQSPAEPSIARWEVGRAAGPAGTIEVTVDWEVTDPDNDLRTVDVTVAEIGPTGLRTEIEDTASVRVSGESAADVTTLTADGDGGGGYQVRLVVTDSADNVAVATTQT